MQTCKVPFTGLYLQTTGNIVLCCHSQKDTLAHINDIDDLEMMGWNMYMTPEQASYGIVLYDDYIKQGFIEDCTSSKKYKDLSKFSIFSESNINK